MVSHKKVYEPFESKHQAAVDESDWIIVRNTHECIVAHEEFDKADANMRTLQRGKKDNPANKRNFCYDLSLLWSDTQTGEQKRYLHVRSYWKNL